MIPQNPMDLTALLDAPTDIVEVIYEDGCIEYYVISEEVFDALEEEGIEPEYASDYYPEGAYSYVVYNNIEDM